MKCSKKARSSYSRWFCPFLIFAFLGLPSTAHASFLHGETLDTVAGVIAWFAFIIVPPVLIAVFLLVHILPEKIAEKRHHPQLGAIKCLCLLSLCFGGLLWPIAWLWAYTKPVLHKMAYGTDKHPDYYKEHGLPDPHEDAAPAAGEPKTEPVA